MRQLPAGVVAAATAATTRYPSVPASISLAQFIDESAWGERMPPGSNNPFGIKAVAGQPHVDVPTHEFLNGRYVSITAAFAAYPSLAEAFEEHARLLATGGAYQPFRLAQTVQGKCNALTGHYATDPQYGLKLWRLIQEEGLLAFDRPEAGA